jgi:hypothetical protein
MNADAAFEGWQIPPGSLMYVSPKPGGMYRISARAWRKSPSSFLE